MDASNPVLWLVCCWPSAALVLGLIYGRLCKRAAETLKEVEND